jgi:hypothetical protein
MSAGKDNEESVHLPHAQKLNTEKNIGIEIEANVENKQAI